MQLHGNEITIHQGEAFTFHRILKNRDGTPYIISDELVNAHFLLTITNTLYAQSGRYLKKYWLKISDNLPTFDLTVPLHIKNLKNAAGETLYNTLDSITSFPITCYINGEYVSVGDRYAVFYDDDKKYKYWDDGWKNYECRIIKPISSDDTSNWSISTYLYSIQLVTGERGECGLSRIDNSIPILSPAKIKVISN